MTYTRHTLMIAAMLLLQGCEQQVGGAKRPAASNATGEAGEVARIDADVRITAANKRIEELERQVGQLQSTPEKLNLELLTARVAALEVRAAGTSNDGIPTSSGERSGARVATPATTRTEAKTESPSVPRLPTLENRTRLATPDEAERFARGK